MNMLDKLKPAPTIDPDTAMTPDEAAQMLKISKATLARLTADGEIPAARLGARCVRYRRAAILAWLKEREGAFHGKR